MKAMLHYYRQLHKFAGVKLYFNLFGMVVSGLLESVAILLLMPMLSLAGIPLGGGSGSTHFKMFDALLDLPQSLTLLIVLGSYLLIIFVQNMISRTVKINNVNFQQDYGRYHRMELFGSLLRAEWSFFLKKRSSDLVHLVTEESARVTGGINYFLQIMTSAVSTLVQIGLAFWLAPGLTLLVLVCGILLSLFSRRFIRRASQLGVRTSDIGKTFLAGVTDQLNGIKDIKSNNLENSRLEWMKDMLQKLKEEQIDYIKLRMSSQTLYKMASTSMIVCFIFISFQFLEISGPSLLLIIIIFSRLWPTFTSIQALMEQLASTLPSFNRVWQFNKDCEEAAELSISSENEENISTIHMVKGLEVRNLYFRYQTEETLYALQNININIPANQMTAVVGRSGAGKSTLIDLLMGLMQPEEGEILVDDMPITGHNLLPFRRSIGYVAQDPFLYNASIRDNLMMIKPSAGEEDLWEALEFASSADFVRKLPQGLDTLIGDRGVRLSGGERQRLVLARAMIRKPSILVLDEATSSLDTENEKKIQEALDRLKHSITIIVIAHRLSTIRNADQILVIDGGHVVQQGKFTGLASEKDGIFSSLLSNQEEAM